MAYIFYEDGLHDFLVKFSRITTCEGIIDQIDRSPNSFAERAILETLKGSKYSRDDYDLINPIFGTYINCLLYTSDAADE